METKQVIMYVIVNKKQKPELNTLAFGKSECIKTFMTNICGSWNGARKFGWKCIKVDVTIQTSENKLSD